MTVYPGGAGSGDPGQSLAGTTVVVTRARHQAGPLVAALGAVGARVVEVPVIDLVGPADGGEALRRVAAELDGYRWIAFTSANAVRRLLLSLPGAGSLAGVGVAAVGDATARALSEGGVRPDLVAEPSTAEGLVAAFPDPPGPGARVLFPRAAEGRETLPVGLRARGWEVDEVVAYRTVPAQPPADEVVADLVGADVVTFTSPSTVRAYLSLRTRGGLALPVPPTVACIGPVTAAAAREVGLEVSVEAASPSARSIVDALVAGLGNPGAA